MIETSCFEPELETASRLLDKIIGFSEKGTTDSWIQQQANNIKNWAISCFRTFRNEKVAIAVQTPQIKTFTLGSSKADVLAAMGTPTDNNVICFEGNAWGFGGATVYFNRQDCVVGWNNLSKDLIAQMNNGTIVKGATFTEGSTEADVLKAMGTPTKRLPRKDDNEYYYLDFGNSTVFFGKDGLVHRWQNNDNNLKLHMKEGQQSRGATFDLGSSKAEVIAAMGEPTDNNVVHPHLYGTAWAYRGSKVYFNQQGCVDGWDDAFNISKLRMKEGQTVKEAPFAMGSTEAEVLKAMGTPTKRLPRKYNNEYYYLDFGNSTVFFGKDGLVYRWQNNDNNLMIRMDENNGN